MRLTLRTLLAYLDNTLEPTDAEVLQTKLAESSFATQLVQRIRLRIADRRIAAPDPHAVGPLDDPNVIGEYLDSTMPAQQVAETEKACLESDLLLAEAAACHQVLTMVLGKVAVVPDSLRRRIHELPDRELADISAGTSFSAIAIPENRDLDGQDDIPTSEPTSASVVQPVGPLDSGVSDAPTRLRQSEAIGAAEKGSATAMAGSRSRDSIEASDMYDGSIRPSRITPWLVSLALAGVLAFAVMQVFSPLLNEADQPQVADNSIRRPGAEVIVSPIESPPMQPVVNNSETLPAPAAEPDVAGAPDTAGDPDAASAEEPLSPPVTTADPDLAPPSTDAATPSKTPEPIKSPDPGPATDTESATPPTSPDANEREPMNNVAPVEPVPVAVSPVEEMPTPDATPEQPTASVDLPPSAEKLDPASAAEPTTEPDSADSGAPDVVSPPAAVGVDLAKFVAGPTLAAGHDGSATNTEDVNWVRLVDEMLIGNGATVVCAPHYRAKFVTMSELDVTVIGPAKIRWSAHPSGGPTIQIDYGRVLISSMSDGRILGLKSGQKTIELAIPKAETLVAVSTIHGRPPGADPFEGNGRETISSVLCVQGEVRLAVAEQNTKLETGELWESGNSGEPVVILAPNTPDWIDPPAADDTSVAALARNGLLDELKDDQPLLLSLQEATSFRRAEVGALAAQTLLFLGRSDVYFGGDGILGQPKQRNYWLDHYQAIATMFDTSSESAKSIREAILRMDSGNAKTIIRLLTGFSQNQLAEGGDATLVESLDSSSMTVRVLALEILNRITGMTLNFRPDQDNAIRRAPEIDKWKVRLRKGDIRWPEK